MMLRRKLLPARLTKLRAPIQLSPNGTAFGANHRSAGIIP